MENRFDEKDKERIIEFLNFIAEKAEFPNLKVSDIIKMYGSLAYMQKELLMKVDANILEVVAVHEPEKKKPAPKKTTTRKK